MRALYIAVVCAALASGTWTCKGDPTADLRGGPASVDLVPGQIFIDEGKATALLVAVRDEQLNTIAADIGVTSADASVATVAVDTTRPVVDGARHAYVVDAKAPGHTRLNVTGAGLSDTVAVSVLPLAFNGAISTLTPKGGDTVVINSTSVLKFNPATVAITFPGGQTPTVLGQSANAVTVLAPFSDVGPLTIDGVVVTYVTGLEVTLPSAGVMHQTGDHWAGANSWQTAPDITSILPGAGATTHFIATSPAASNVAVCPEGVLGFGSSGPCVMFKFTLADSTVLNFTTDWIGTSAAPDIDVYACADSTVAAFGANCFEDGGGGATGSKPQATGNFKYPPGTHYYVIENYAGATSRNLYTSISRP
ncbi:MAG TPA: hypothetical protein VLV16_01970 [Gemmatimonadales bacterium]|nr:hypothetical protein [Gemmatimonadales bacterium]